MFVKGQSGNPAGKPKGTKDKKWQSIQAMWDMFVKDFSKLTPAQRAHYSFEMVKLHFERAIAQIPKEASESLSNANNLLMELKALESKSGRSTDVISDVPAAPLVNRTPPVSGDDPVL